MRLLYNDVKRWDTEEGDWGKDGIAVSGLCRLYVCQTSRSAIRVDVALVSGRWGPRFRPMGGLIDLDRTSWKGGQCKCTSGWSTSDETKADEMRLGDIGDFCAYAARNGLGMI